MFCPQCGHQQISDETRFCSRCGFQLGLVPTLLKHGGDLPQLAEIRELQKSRIFNRKNGVAFSFIWFAFCMFLAIVFDDFLKLSGRFADVLLITGFFGWFIMLVVSLAYLPSSKKKSLPDIPTIPVPHSLHGNTGQNALPPQQTQPLDSYIPADGNWRAPETGEFTTPGSVTDHTTKLLKEDK